MKGREEKDEGTRKEGRGDARRGKKRERDREECDREENEREGKVRGTINDIFSFLNWIQYKNEMSLY